MKALINVSTLCLASGLLACGAESDPQYDQIATGMGAMVADPQGGEARTFHDSILAARGEIPLGLQLASGGLFVGQRGELELRYELTCKDASGATLADCAAAASADYKAEWKGKVENERYKLEVDRKGEWKVTGFDGEIATVEGKTHYTVKSDFKDSAEDVRHKYDFDYDAHYHKVQVRVSDGVIVGGTADYDVDAKEKHEEDETQIKSSLKLKIDAVFEESGEAILSFDSKYKYKLQEDGEVVWMEKIEASGP